MVKVITDITNETNDMIVMFQKKNDIKLKSDAVKLILELWADDNLNEFRTRVIYEGPRDGIL